jgi:subtilisin family serine protease
MPVKNILKILLPAALLASPAIEANAFEPLPGVMTERLSSTINSSDPEDNISVMVYLEDDLDLQALDNQLTLAAAGKKERHSQVVGAILQASGEAQKPILSLLSEARASGEVAAYKEFWINNSIAITGRAAFIAGLSLREEVEWMTLDRVHRRLDPVERSSELFYFLPEDTLRKKSYPIRFLGLDSLWERGLTGKGILVCSIGSGTDGNHPLLTDKWRGHNGGTAAESWFDAVEGSSFPFDDERNSPSHGTGVMGIILGGTRSLGVAYDAQWIAAKVFDNENLSADGASTTKDSYFTAAFQWALDPDGNPETTVDVPDVINNSWGTLGEYQEDICQEKLWSLLDRIEAAGTVVVFSAGNEGPELFSIGSPASRSVSPVNSFAIGSVDSLGRVSAFSSRGPSACDSLSIKPNICAPGEKVITIVASNYVYGYTSVNGTSFASPYMAGIAALMKQANPTLTPQRIKELMLETATDAGAPGPDYAYGYGIINPRAIFEQIPAPETPVLYTKRVETEEEDGNGNGYLEPGETIQIKVPVFNSGIMITGVSAVMRTENSGVVLIDSTAFYGDIDQLGGVVNDNDPFVFRILPDAPTGTQLLIYIDLTSTDGLYQISLQVTLPIAPAVEDLALHDVGSFDFSFTNYGQFGGNIGPSDAGQGLRYPRNAPYSMLYRGALLVGTSSLKVSDGIADFDFAPGPGGPIKLFSDNLRADQVGVSYIKEKSEGSFNAIGVKIMQTTLAWSESPNDDFVILEYRVLNPHPATLKNLYIGLYADWDIPDSLPSRNAVGYDGSLQMGYLFNPQETIYPYGGLTLVSNHNVSGHRAVRNSSYIHRGYSDNIAFSFMSGGINAASADSLDDWSQILASGPHEIAPGDSITVAWALVVGDNLPDLIANTQAAKAVYGQSLNLASETPQPNTGGPALPRAFSLAQNHPNPFNPSTTIEYSLPDRNAELQVRLSVFNLRGALVAVLVDKQQSGGNYSVNWDGTDRNGKKISSGVYFYRLQAGDFSAVRKMVLVK